MNILFLDDDQSRIKLVKPLLPKGINYVKSSRDAIETLQSKEEWDIIFLDHDLGSYHGNGYDVALWIAKYQPIIRNIIVHSFNPVGAKQIQQLLKRHKYKCRQLPFDKLYNNLLQGNYKL